MGRSPEEYLNLPYSKVLVPDEAGGYVAEVLEFPGCIAEGETADEAVENLNLAMEAWIEAVQEDGGTVPEPLDLQDFSGRVLLRLPKWLHKEATRHAQVEGVSVNQWLVDAVAERVGTDRYHERVRQIVGDATPLMFFSAQRQRGRARSFADAWTNASFQAPHILFQEELQSIFETPNEVCKVDMSWMKIARSKIARSMNKPSKDVVHA